MCEGILFNVGGQTGQERLLTWADGAKSRRSSGSNPQPFAPTARRVTCTTGPSFGAACEHILIARDCRVCPMIGCAHPSRTGSNIVPKLCPLYDSDQSLVLFLFHYEKPMLFSIFWQRSTSVLTWPTHVVFPKKSVVFAWIPLEAIPVDANHHTMRGMGTTTAWTLARMSKEQAVQVSWGTILYCWSISHDTKNALHPWCQSNVFFFEIL